MKMHGMNNIKFINPKQAKEIHQYKNLKVKLHKANAAIWYNKMCKQLQLTPQYFSIKVSGSNCQSHETLKAATQFRKTSVLP
jgi:hypothetical protein